MDTTVMGHWDLPMFAWGIDYDIYWDNYHFYGFRHVGNTANMLYMDGHVEAVKHHKDTGKNIYRSLYSAPP